LPAALLALVQVAESETRPLCSGQPRCLRWVALKVPGSS
jgi:hypothetical protein